MKTMKKVFLIVCIKILILGCSPVHKYNPYDNRTGTNMNGLKEYELQVRNFDEIPQYILDNLNKMGVDNSPMLNEYEGKFLNTIFKTDINDFNLVGKKVAFIGSKKDYFKETRERLYRNSTTIGGSCVYIFNDAQKVESGGYDAAIVYWNKKSLTIREVIKRLKRKK